MLWVGVYGEGWRFEVRLGGLGQGGNSDELLGVMDTVRIWVRSEGLGFEIRVRGCRVRG